MKHRKIYALGVLVAVFSLLAPAPAQAFKLKTHAIIANEALNAINGDADNATIEVPNIGEVALHNPEVVEAVKAYPSYYRAGSLGPDVFPDLIGGQIWVHVNNGNEDNLSAEECVEAGNCIPAGVPHEQRVVADWRSIDYGMYMLRRASEFKKGAAAPEDRAKRLQALAFAYGYLTHMMGDGFAHSYVNEWARSVFNYFEGHPGAFYGPATEEIQHMAVESYIDVHMPPISDDDLRIDAPEEFLVALYTERVEQAGGWSAPGEFAGDYFTFLIKLRNEFEKLAHRERWAESAPGGDLAVDALKLDRQIKELITLGTLHGDPIADIEDYFDRRRAMVDFLLTKWVVLSECVAQNILLGANSGPGEIVEQDACNIDFEDNELISDIFRGDLNEAVHYGAGKPEFDFGGVGVNMTKIQKFLTEILARALIFSPTEDIRSLRQIKRLVQDCRERLVDWDSCDEACTDARKECTKTVIKAVCAFCPTEDGKVDCYDGEICFCSNLLCTKKTCSEKPKPFCTLNTICFACERNGLEQITDLACVATVNAAAPVCEFCSDNMVCRSVEAVEAVDKAIDQFLTDMMLRVIAPLIDEVKRELLEQYAGPYVNDYIALYKEIEGRKARAGAAWFVNIAFLKEDLLEDPEYLNQILQQMLAVGGELVSNAAEISSAVEETYQRTKTNGEALLRTYIELESGQTYASIWRHLIDLLYRISRDGDFSAVASLGDSAYNWLNQFSFRSDNRKYETRLAKFIALVAELTKLMEIRGPTARMLRVTMQLSEEVLDTGAGSLDLQSFHPVRNAIELTKLGFLSGEGIHELGLMAGITDIDEGRPFGFYPRFYDLSSPSGTHGVSEICRAYPHIACDAIQSLDDPNHYGHSMPEGARVGNRDIAYLDAERSFASWESRDEARRSTQCNLGLTNFLLAASDETYTKLYHKVFLLPEYCRVLEVSERVCKAYQETLASDSGFVLGEVFVDSQLPDGRRETGSSASPFNTIGEALCATPTGGTVWLRGGTYVAPISLNRGMTIKSYDGTAIIRGQQSISR